MSGAQNMSTGDQKRLDQYLRQCDRLMANLDPATKSQMLLAIAEHLTAQISPTRPMASILLQNRPVEQFLIGFFQTRGMTFKPKKSFGLLKKLLLALGLIVLAMTLLIYWGIKSSLNWLENSENLSVALEQMKIEDGKMRFQVDLDAFPGQDSSTLKNVQNGEVDPAQIRSIGVMIESGVAAIEKGDVFSFNCKTDQSNYNPVELQADKLVLKLVGKNQCRLLLPPAIPFEIRQQTGVLLLKGMDQSFSVFMDQGTVQWDSLAPLNFEVTTKVNGVELNSATFALAGKGQFKAHLEVKQGVLKIK